MAAKRTSGPKDAASYRIGGRLDHDAAALFEALQYVLGNSSTDTVVRALIALTDSLPASHQDVIRRSMGIRKASLSRLRKGCGLTAQNEAEALGGEVVGVDEPLASRMSRINGLAERTFDPIDAAIARMAE